MNNESLKHMLDSSAPKYEIVTYQNKNLLTISQENKIKNTTVIFIKIPAYLTPGYKYNITLHVHLIPSPSLVGKTVIVK